MGRLRDLRKRKGLTQTQCAERIGVGHAAVHLWETGESIPSSISAARYAEVLGITVAELNESLAAGSGRASALGGGDEAHT